MVSALLRQVFFFPQTTRISILHRIPVLANARPNFPSPSLPLRNHTSRSLSTSALRLILQSPVSTIGYAPSSTLASLSPKHLDPLPWTIRIPPICPGCGARSQTTDPNVPGFYDQEKAQAKAIKRKEKKEKRNMDKKRNAEEAIRLANLARLEQVMKQAEEEGKGELVEQKGIEMEAGVEQKEAGEVTEVRSEVGPEEVGKKVAEILEENEKEAGGGETEKTDVGLLEENRKEEGQKSEQAEVEADEIMLEQEAVSSEGGESLVGKEGEGATSISPETGESLVGKEGEGATSISPETQAEKTKVICEEEEISEGRKPEQAEVEADEIIMLEQEAALSEGEGATSISSENQAEKTKVNCEEEEISEGRKSKQVEVEADEIIMLEQEDALSEGGEPSVGKEGEGATSISSENQAEKTKVICEEEEISEGRKSEQVEVEADEIIMLEQEDALSEGGEPSVGKEGEGATSISPETQAEKTKVICEEEEISEELVEVLSEKEEIKLRDAELGLDIKKFDFITRNIAAKPTTSSDCPATTPAPVSTDSLLTPRPTAATPKLPLCERCKSLVNYERGTPLPAYPDLDTLIDLISESKHEKTHIYHLIDAADFPLSLIPRLKSYLAHYLPPKKARNLSVSYIITRADLLMPKEEQVTSLMTYLKGVLKDALPPGEAIEDHHSPWGGSFRVISIKNAWSIRRVKAEFSHMAGLKLSKAEKGIVKSREGGIWIVGKVNVGKSRFVGEIVPEGSFTNLERVIETVSGPRASYSPELETLTGKEKLEVFLKKVEGKERVNNPQITKEELAKILEEARIKLQNEELDQEELSLVSPTVSYIPGTTVAPVRVAFRHPGEKGRKGGIKGEIIDLPGMERGRFLDFVRPKLRRKVHMESRVDPKQHVVKPGQSLVLAGLIMIRPKTCDTDFLMYPYTALPTHVTATEKALEFMNHPDPEMCREPVLYQLKPEPSTDFVEDKVKESTKSSTLERGSVLELQASGEGSIYRPQELKNKPVSAPLAGTLPDNIKSAGTFHLSTDVTRLRNPQLRDKADAEIELLPYKIYSIDILLEGVGWVEIVAQIRTHQLMLDVVPEVEVYTPLGKGVGSRKPMGADMLRLQGLKKIGKFGVRRNPTEGRQRQSMKGRKKQSKINHRSATGGRG